MGYGTTQRLWLEKKIRKLFTVTVAKPCHLVSQMVKVDGFSPCWFWWRLIGEKGESFLSPLWQNRFHMAANSSLVDVCVIRWSPNGLGWWIYTRLVLIIGWLAPKPLVHVEELPLGRGGRVYMYSFDTKTVAFINDMYKSLPNLKSIYLYL